MPTHYHYHGYTSTVAYLESVHKREEAVLTQLEGTDQYKEETYEQSISDYHVMVSAGSGT